MAETTVKRHPIRGALYGLLLGLAVWFFLQFQFASFGFDSLGGVITRAVIVIVAGTLVGVVWAYLAPARGPKGAAPATAAPAAAPAPAPMPMTDDASQALPSDDSPELPDDDE